MYTCCFPHSSSCTNVPFMTLSAVGRTSLMLGLDLVTSSLGAEDSSDCILVFSWNATFPPKNHSKKLSVKGGRKMCGTQVDVSQAWS